MGHTLNYVEFDYLRGNPDIMKGFSISAAQAYHERRVNEAKHNVMIVNHEAREFFICKTIRVETILGRWRRWFNTGGAGALPVVVVNSVELVSKDKVSVIVLPGAGLIGDNPVLARIKELEAKGWTSLAPTHVQTRVKSKDMTLYKVTDIKSGLSRYTLSCRDMKATRELSFLYASLRETIFSVLISKRMRGVRHFALISKELEEIRKRMYATMSHTKLKATVMAESTLALTENAGLVTRLNRAAIDDWLKSKYVKDLISQYANQRLIEVTTPKENPNEIPDQSFQSVCNVPSGVAVRPLPVEHHIFTRNGANTSAAGVRQSRAR